MNEAKGRYFRKERTNTFPMATKSRSLMDVHRLQTCWNSPSTFLESSDSFKKTFRAPLGNVKAPLVFPLKWNTSLVWPPSTPRTHCLPATTSPTLPWKWAWQWLQPFFWFWAPDMKCTFGITLIPLMPLSGRVGPSFRASWGRQSIHKMWLSSQMLAAKVNSNSIFWTLPSRPGLRSHSLMATKLQTGNCLQMYKNIS